MPETRTHAGGATEHLLRLLEALSYEGMPITVLEAAGDTWVPATEVGRALGLHDNIVRRVVQRNAEVFESLTTTLEAIWRQGATSLRVDPVEIGNCSPVRTQAQASTLFLNYSGVLAVLLKLDTSRIKRPEARARVVRFFRWALKDLRQAMQGRALPAGAGAAPVGVPAWVDALSPAERSRLHRGFFDSAKGMPVSILVPMAASIGISLDAAAVEAERQARLEQEAATRRLPRAVGGAGAVELRASGGAANGGAGEGGGGKGEEASAYLAAIRRVIAAYRDRIAGLEAVDATGRRVVPAAGYIGGLGRAHGVEVVGILATPLKTEMARAMGTYNGKAFLAAMEQAGVLVPDPKHPGQAAGLHYTRDDGQAVNLRHICFRREAVLPGAMPGAPGHAAPQVAQ